MVDRTGELTLLERTLTPSAEAVAALSQVTIIPIVGPIAVGKSACIDELVNLDERFERVRSFTTRPQRSGEPADQYKFLPHTEDVIDDISNRAARGELVQLKVHPTTGYVYGSDFQAYSGRFMLLDTMAGGVDFLKRLPFRGFSEVSLVVKPEEWLRRFSARVMSSDEARERIREGCDSLAWSLDHGSQMPWIYNGDGLLEDASYELRNLAADGQSPSPRNRKLGEELLQFLTSIVSD